GEWGKRSEMGQVGGTVVGVEGRPHPAHGEGRASVFSLHPPNGRGRYRRARSPTAIFRHGSKPRADDDGGPRYGRRPAQRDAPSDRRLFAAAGRMRQLSGALPGPAGAGSGPASTRPPGKQSALSAGGRNGKSGASRMAGDGRT